jgi:hypothetical protein
MPRNMFRSCFKELFIGKQSSRHIKGYISIHNEYLPISIGELFIEFVCGVLEIVSFRWGKCFAKNANRMIITYIYI